MQRLFLLLLLCLVTSSAKTQAPESHIPLYETTAHINFLASDELQGRRTGAPGNFVAARYIAEQFRAYGVQPLPNAQDFFQLWPLESVVPPSGAVLTVGKQAYEYRKDFILLSGKALQFKGNAVFAGHGWVDATSGHDDYKGLDVKGKVVFAASGLPDDNNLMTAFNSASTKQKLAEERGAVALIELYRLGFPWPFALQFFGRPSHRIGEENPQSTGNLPYGWLKEKGNDPIAALVKGTAQKVILSSSGGSHSTQLVTNVVGVIEGTDPVLKNEYVLLSAHFDHVGTGQDGGGAFTAEDSIFNGARDNAFGTTALLAAARVLAQNPPKRSVILLACNGEEMGLLGSKYYADHPLVPLQQTIFNLNADGAGYNDTEHVSVVGFGRTGTDELLIQAAEDFGLKILPNPMPEQNLYDRSDNASFAAKGVPSVCISPGITAFDQQLMRYYHQTADHADSIDMAYLHKYCQTFARMARLLADSPQLPTWKAGDKYEKAGKALYSK